MTLTHGRDDTDVRPGDLSEHGDLARLVRAHLEDDHVGLLGDRQERQRHPDPVVEVAAGRVHSPRRAERRSGEILGGGLS